MKKVSSGYIIFCGGHFPTFSAAFPSKAAGENGLNIITATGAERLEIVYSTTTAVP
jgi:hypothetical protein